LSGPHVQFRMDKIAVAGLIAGSIGALAAVAAAWFAWKAPTKKDLERVENNTAETSQRLERVRSHIASVDERLAEQHSYDLLVSRAQRVALAVNGEDRTGVPLRFALRLKDTAVLLTHVELFNEVGTNFGSADCTLTEPPIFSATLDPNTTERWYGGGTVDQMIGRMRLRLRVHMQIDKRDVYRDVAVHLIQTTRPNPSRPNSMERVFILEGNC
jgi:hypothetical protein